MIGRRVGRAAVLSLAMVCSAGAASAQQCTNYRVDTSLLNISKDAGGHIYKDVLFDGDVACVTRRQNVGGQEWGYIQHKLEGATQTPVDGWASLQLMQPVSPGAAASAPARPPAAAAPSVTPGAPPPVAAAPPAAATPGGVRPEDMLRFDQPIPFGPFPVNGRTIAELATTSVPLFSPIEGLDESLWKKQCTTCHQWDQPRLCEQGLTYVNRAKDILRHQHPFGGAYKLALMRWAKSGCD